MATDRLNSTLQENLLTLLCHDDTHGRVVANLLQPSLFEGDYRVIAEAAVTYWHRHREAPKLHTPDLVGEILDDPNNRKGNTYRRILNAMLQLADTINSAYVLDQLRLFVRTQQLKQAIVESAERINADQEMAITDIEQIWNDLLRTREIEFSAGLRLTAIDQVLDYMQMQYAEFTTGIPALDDRHIVPARDTVMLMLGATGRGKTWWLINLGKQALLQRKKVLHISLEMGEEQVAQRYYQDLFSVTKRDDLVEITTLDVNRLGAIEGFGKEKVRPEFTFASSMVRDELEHRINWWGTRLNNLIIKRFSTMTIDDLEAYMDNLEVTEGFIPDMILLDYIGLVDTGTSGKDFRIGLGQVFKRFRGLCIRRHAAGATAQQSSKKGASAQTIGLGHVAEDWSLTNTADMVLTYSSTDSEARLGLGRLYVAKARDETDKFGVLLTQNYRMGQFVLDSMELGPEYFDLLNELPDEKPEEEDDDGED